MLWNAMQCDDDEAWKEREKASKQRTGNNKSRTRLTVRRSLARWLDAHSKSRTVVASWMIGDDEISIQKLQKQRFCTTGTLDYR